MCARRFDMRARDNVMLGHADHRETPLLAPPRQPLLVGAGNIAFPGLAHGLQPDHVGHGKGSFIAHSPASAFFWALSPGRLRRFGAIANLPGDHFIPGLATRCSPGFCQIAWAGREAVARRRLK